MDTLDLSRLQFAVVTIYHYFFVPLSISLAAITAGLQTAWVRTGRHDLQRLTMFTGKLLMVTFAVGVVTGLVQEFQFGLSWSAFSRFYGDVFGPTLAIEGMLAFFLEATFLGLWFFGWDRMPRLAHLATIWIVAVGTLISAFVILGANSFMQNPVAYDVDPETGRAELTSFAELMTNPVNLAAYPHTLAGAFMTGGALVLAISAWRAWGRGPAREAPADDDHATWRSLARVGAWVTLVAGAAVVLTGDHLGKVITEVQPMKMAAAEALFATETGAAFSIFAVGPLDGGEPFFSLDIPYVLSVLATGDPTSTVHGITDLQGQYEQQYGPGSYVPWVPVAYWTFRLMIGTGVVAIAAALALLWASRGGRTPGRDDGGTSLLARVTRVAGRLLLRFLPLIPLLPVAANTFGWLFTETARQPWLVFGLFRTEDGVSPGLTEPEVLASLLGFGVLYGILAVVWLRLVLHLSRQDLTGSPGTPTSRPGDGAEPAALVPAY
ncbi:cytochrome ubiquinol oxidase subunit I [Georgenia halophila]|uniref:Cytochrome ubiquinol oxidase subunit I n=1 Tax=Georgenia halophila TaxID=620889 RepID=A0ABP8LCR2_9MICO